MPTLTLTRGLPGSGKSTWALEQVRAGGGKCARLNRDDIRCSVFGAEGVLAFELEQRVTAIQQANARALLAAGVDVIVDDTNLRAKFARQWADLARELGVDFAVEDFTAVPLETCIYRDDVRAGRGERSVGEETIRSMHAKFLASGRLAPVTPTERPEATPPRLYMPTPGLAHAWMIDVDGTLALMGQHEGVRSPYDWARVGEDQPNPAVIELAQSIRSRAGLVIMSARDEVCRPETENWLLRHLGAFDALVMRPAGDNRKDAVVKAELFWDHVAPRWNVRGVLDDRRQVVEMWRAMGLMCAQVAPGDF